MTNARKRAIKMYWKMAKEKCPFQTEEIVNGYLEGFIDCAEYLLLQNTELEKENAELRKLKRECETSLCRAEYQYNYEQLTKAKEIIKGLLSYEQIPRDCLKERYRKLLDEAEQFLNENSTYERIQKAKYNYTD